MSNMFMAYLEELAGQRGLGDVAFCTFSSANKPAGWDDYEPTPAPCRYSTYLSATFHGKWAIEELAAYVHATEAITSRLWFLTIYWEGYTETVTLQDYKLWVRGVCGRLFQGVDCDTN